MAFNSIKNKYNNVSREGAAAEHGVKHLKDKGRNGGTGSRTKRIKRETWLGIGKHTAGYRAKNMIDRSVKRTTIRVVPKRRRHRSGSETKRVVLRGNLRQ